jgi:predicted lipid carrier protein YhbT
MKLPDFTLPAPFAALAGRLPQMPPTLALVAALNLALGRVLPRDTLEPLLGKHLRIRVLDAGMTLRFVLTERGFRPSFDGAAADLSISARVRDFLSLALREEDADTLFFSRRLVMEGDTELGLLVKNTLDAIELPRLRLADLAPRQVAGRLAAKLPGLLSGR